MPETPDPDPLTKVIGALRTAVDDLARLVEHPTVKNVLGGLLSALGREDAPAAAAEPRAGAGAAKARAASATKPAASNQSRAATKAPAKTKPAGKAKAAGRAAAASGAAASKPAPAARAGGRREDLLVAIGQHPGISIAAAAKQIGVAPGGLYPVARKLEADGLIRKEGTGWLTTAPAS